MRAFGVLAAVAAALVIGSSSAQADLIVNGGFEDPANTPPGGFVTYFGGQAIPGWLVGGDSVDVHHTGHTTALAGILTCPPKSGPPKTAESSERKLS